MRPLYHRLSTFEAHTYGIYTKSHQHDAGQENEITELTIANTRLLSGLATPPTGLPTGLPGRISRRNEFRQPGHIAYAGPVGHSLAPHIGLLREPVGGESRRSMGPHCWLAALR